MLPLDYSRNINEQEIRILGFIRRCPRRVSLNELCEKLSFTMKEVVLAITFLRGKGYIRQDRRDIVSWEHEEATYFTKPTMREEIDDLLKRHLLSQLRKILARRFNNAELRDLSFDLGIVYDDLLGDGNADKARELVAYHDRRNGIDQLIKAIKRERPDITLDNSDVCS